MTWPDYVDGLDWELEADSPPVEPEEQDAAAADWESDFWDRWP